MEESKLQREFNQRDVQRMRNIITKDYNSAFFAKEIKLPIHVADFANILSNILKADG